MLAFALRRLVASVAVLFCVASLTFLLARSMKGGPFDRERPLPEHLKGELERKYKLSGSLWEQYLSFLADLSHGDLRVSTKYRDWSVSEILAQKMPTSFLLGGTAFLIAAGAGVTIGTYAAIRRGQLADTAAMFGALALISVPTFITGPALVGIFGLWLGWFPIGGWGQWQQLVLPACCLAGPYVAYVARLMRNSLLEVMKSDYLRTARAKGLSLSQAVVRHAMKVAILPVVSFLGPLAANLFTGSMVVESVFDISGAGSVFVNSIQNRDVMLLVGAVIIYCVLLVLFNFIVDILYGLLDKRIKVYG